MRKKKALVKRYLSKTCEEYEAKSYEYWKAQKFPIVFEERIEGLEGKVIEVDIDILESTPEYLHLSVTVAAGGISAYVPYTTGFIVEKKKQPE